MNLFKNIIKKLLVGMLGMHFIIYASNMITDQRYAQLKRVYTHLASMKQVPEQQASNFIRSLLAENWPKESVRSKNMTKWATEIAKKSGLNIYKILPQKVEISSTVKARIEEVLSTTLQNGLLTAGLAVAAGAIAGDFAAADILSALSQGLAQGAVIGSATVAANDLVGPRSFIAQAVPAVASAISGPLPGSVSVSSQITVPGWAVLSGSTAFQAAIQPKIVHEVNKSGIPAQLVAEPAKSATDLYQATKDAAGYLYRSFFGAAQ